MLYSVTIFSVKMTVFIICGVLGYIYYEKKSSIHILLHDILTEYSNLCTCAENVPIPLAVQVDVGSDPPCIKHLFFFSVKYLSIFLLFHS